MSDAGSSAPDADYVHRWNRRSRAVYRAQLSVLYHHKRERFFDSIDRLITVITLVSATAAAAAIYKETQSGCLELILALIAAIASCIQVAYTPATKASLHRQLAADMKRLAAKFEEVGEDWSHSDCDRFTAELLNLEAGEAAPLGALVTQCANEIALADGRFEDIRELGPLQSLFKHWYAFDVTSLKPIDAGRAAELRARSAPQKQTSE